MPDIRRLGEGTVERVVSGEFCRPLWSLSIVAVGISEAAPGFAFETERSFYPIVMACAGGSGWARVNGREVPLGSGQAYLLPRNAPHAYWHAGQGIWRLAWVVFGFDGKPSPVDERTHAEVVPADYEGLTLAIERLDREWAGAADPAVLLAWCGIVDAYARRIARPVGDLPSLEDLWLAVDADLARPWSLVDLSDWAKLSPEVLRRRSIRETGHSPMAHVAYLRMRRAASLLTARDLRVSEVAAVVGYSDPFAFSTAFKRAFGVRPAAYRAGDYHSGTK